jgi:hypothetical protein
LGKLTFQALTDVVNHGTESSRNDDDADDDDDDDDDNDFRKRDKYTRSDITSSVLTLGKPRIRLFTIPLTSGWVDGDTPIADVN